LDPFCRILACGKKGLKLELQQIGGILNGSSNASNTTQTPHHGKESLLLFADATVWSLDLNSGKNSKPLTNHIRRDRNSL
jgi:hypothetical protein